MEKRKLWKWSLRICICLFLTFVGYKIMPFFQENTHFDFAVKNSKEDLDLNVNISIYSSHYSGSKWYQFVKRKTVVYKGIPIEKFNEKDIDYYINYFYLPSMTKKELVSNKENSNYKYYYVFDKIGFSTGEVVSGIYYNFDNHAYIKYIDLKDNHDEKFTYYDPKKAKYELAELSEASLEELNSMSFKELKETDKILTKDIIRLKKLTLGQKKALIEIHNEKKFDFF